MTMEDLKRKERALAVVVSRPPVAMASTPLRLSNPLNGSGGTTKGARYAANARRKTERAKGWMLARRLATDLHGWKPILDPRVIVLTRVSPKPFDSDNLEAAFKSVRDGMAEVWGIDDADPRVTWVTDWRKGKAHAVEASLWVVPSEAVKPLGTVSPAEVEGLSMSRDCGVYCDCAACVKRYSRKPMASDVEVDASDWERPQRSEGLTRNPLDVLNRKREMAERGSDLIGSRYEARVTPNVIRVKGGA